MITWKCTIKTPSNYLQTLYVEAYTHQDAIAFSESQTSGKCIMAVVDNLQSDNNDSSDSNEIDGDSILGLGLIFFIVIAWKYLLLFGIFAICIWFMLKSFRD